MISFSFSRGPPTPCYRLYFRTKYSAGPIFSGLGIVLLLFMAAWRGLLVVPNAPAAGPVSLKTVSRCAGTPGDTDTGEEVDTGDLVTPLLPPLMGQCENIQIHGRLTSTPTSHGLERGKQTSPPLNEDLL